MVTKQQFISSMKEKPDAKALAKLGLFFSPEWDAGGRDAEKAGKNKKSKTSKKSMKKSKRDSNDTPLDNAILVIVPKNIRMEKPVIIDYRQIGSGQKSGEINSVIAVLAEQGSSVQIVLNKTGSCAGRIRDSVRAIVHRDAAVSVIDVCIGGASARSHIKTDIITMLKGNGAEAQITALFFGKDEQKGEIFTAAFHDAPNTKSDIITRCIVNGRAKAVSSGMIQIHKDAHGSIGYEKQAALLLGADAEAEAIPRLEIRNHDVVCGHSSAVGQLDKEQLFYLMSRGLDENAAKQKIAEGYFIPAIEMFKNDKVKKRVYSALAQAFA